MQLFLFYLLFLISFFYQRITAYSFHHILDVFFQITPRQLNITVFGIVDLFQKILISLFFFSLYKIIFFINPYKRILIYPLISTLVFKNLAKLLYCLLFLTESSILELTVSTHSTPPCKQNINITILLVQNLHHVVNVLTPDTLFYIYFCHQQIVRS
jgi:hypothetical protein